MIEEIKTIDEKVKDTLDEDFMLIAGDVRMFLPIIKKLMIEVEDLELRIEELEEKINKIEEIKK